MLGRIRVPRVGGGRPRSRPDRVLADKAYSSTANQAYLRQRSIRCVIPVEVDQAAHRRARGSRGGRPPAFDRVAYRQRHAVECGINLLKQYRAVATRYDKLAVRYETGPVRLHQSPRAGGRARAILGLVVVTQDIPMLGGPGDGQSLTVELDDEGLPPTDLVAFVVEDDAARVYGTYHLEPVAGGTGPPWEYVFTDR